MNNNETIMVNEAYKQFGKWLYSQPFWLQDAVWRIYMGEKIDEEQIGNYADMCIKQAAGKQPMYKSLAVDESLQIKNDRQIAILSLSDVKGVNALADNVSLNFAEKGITVIYGLNGAGKSGFMRIFKKLSGCPYEEPIQPNVFKKSNDVVAPSCRVVISQDGEPREEICDLQNSPNKSLLSVCDVFDTKISNNYITAIKTASYQPFVFTVLTELASIADRVSSHINDLKESVTERTVKVPNELITRANLKWINDISKDTKIPLDCLEWDEKREKELSELPRLLDSEKVKQEIELTKSSKILAQPIFDELKALTEIYKEDEFDNKYKAMLLKKEKYETSQMLFSENANEFDRASVKMEVWKDLWAYARTYYESFLASKSGKHFGENYSVCPLCYQTISGEIQKRFSNVNEYINGSCNKEYQNARKEFISFCKLMTQRQITAEMVQNNLSTGDLSSFVSDAQVADVSSAFRILQNLDEVQDEEKLHDEIRKIRFDKIFEIINNLMKSLDIKINNLNKALQDNSKEKLQSRFEELQCQKWVYDNKELIQRVINNHKYIAELNGVKPYLTTNKITNEANKLAEALITKAYIDRFTKELAAMAPNIKVQLEKAPSKKGNSPYKVSIAAENGKKYNPEDILSEGEQRIVALAAFFADAAGREEHTPIIIDDPISSLDLNYEDAVIKRIAEIAQFRQVIVFTHRISLLVGIGEVCESKDVPKAEIHIRSTQGGNGVPDLESIYHGKIPMQLSGIKDRLHDAKKLDRDSEEYIACIGRACQQFRICIERSIEDVLLLGMVRRFSRRIITNNKVMKLASIEEKDCKIIDNMMSKYSFIEHSQPADSMQIQYDIDEIERDIDLFSEWIKNYNKRQK